MLDADIMEKGGLFGMEYGKKRFKMCKISMKRGLKRAHDIDHGYPVSYEVTVVGKVAFILSKCFIGALFSGKCIRSFG